VSLYARGMTVREIQVHLTELYGTEVSPSLISPVTDAVSEEAKAWHESKQSSVQVNQWQPHQPKGANCI